MCIDIAEIWFWIANGQIISTFDIVICPPHDSGGVLSFQVFISFSVGFSPYFSTRTVRQWKVFRPGFKVWFFRLRH